MPSLKKVMGQMNVRNEGLKAEGTGKGKNGIWIEWERRERCGRSPDEVGEGWSGPYLRNPESAGSRGLNQAGLGQTQRRAEWKEMSGCGGSASEGKEGEEGRGREGRRVLFLSSSLLLIVVFIGAREG